MSRSNKALLKSDGNKVAEPRVSVAWKAGMKTFGTKNYLSFTAKDISATGIFLKIDDPRAKAPFQHKTLLEIVFYPDVDLIQEEISVTAVVVRAVEGNGRDRFKEEFGVRIVEAPDWFSKVLTEALRAA